MKYHSTERLAFYMVLPLGIRPEYKMNLSKNILLFKANTIVGLACSFI